MALTVEQLGRIEALFSGLGADSAATDGAAVDGAVTEFRQHFPGVSMTRCDLSDMSDEPPFRRFSLYSLYLVDRSEHCWRLTSDPARATGIVLAQHKAAV